MLSGDDAKRMRREIFERAKLEAPDEDLSDLDDEPPPQPRIIHVVPTPPPPEPPPPPVIVEEAKQDDEATRRAELARRLFHGRIKGAKRGKHQSGPAPYGYKRGKDAELLIDEAEAEMVRFIFREYLRLRSMKKLIELLDAHGRKTRRNCAWSRAGISWILKNNTYVGRVHFGEVKGRGIHKPIVAHIIFNKAQMLIRKNDKRRERRAGLLPKPVPLDTPIVPQTPPSTDVHTEFTRLTDGPSLA